MKTNNQGSGEGAALRTADRLIDYRLWRKGNRIDAFAAIELCPMCLAKGAARFAPRRGDKPAAIEYTHVARRIGSTLIRVEVCRVEVEGPLRRRELPS